MIDFQKKIPVIEMYPCLQAEGKYAGVPSLMIRTTGCTMRCQFSDTDFCDSWYTSWAPEKGKYSLNDFIALIKKHPQIKHTIITGGSPTMHPVLVNELCEIAKSYNHFITMETEGSKFQVMPKLDFISLSPKLLNSLPRVGTIDPTGKMVTQKQLEQHEKHRCNYKDMKLLISNHDYQLKPVISELTDFTEVLFIQTMLGIPNDKVYIMPAGGTADELQHRRAWIMEECWKRGYNYTDRMHIVAYGTKREV